MTSSRHTEGTKPISLFVSHSKTQVVISSNTRRVNAVIDYSVPLLYNGFLGKSLPKIVNNERYPISSGQRSTKQGLVPYS